MSISEGTNVCFHSTPRRSLSINTSLFGIPIAVRWYGVLIVGGAMLAGWISARRAERRGYSADHI